MKHSAARGATPIKLAVSHGFPTSEVGVIYTHLPPNKRTIASRTDRVNNPPGSNLSGERNATKAAAFCADYVNRL